MPLHIQVGVIYDNEISNRYEGINTPTDSVENIKQAMELLGIEAYAVYSTEGARKRLYVSERLRQHEEKEQQQQQEHNEKMEKLLQEFKALPAVLKKWDFKHIRIQIEKPHSTLCPAHYDPRISSGLNVGVYIRVYGIKENGQNGDDLHISVEECLSQSGAILRKRFHPNMEADVEEIASKLKEIIKAKEEIERQYHIRRY